MQRGEQNTRKGPKMPTPEEIQIMKAHRKEHLKRIETDPEYRKNWEKQKANFRRAALLNDIIDSIPK
jgi:hypothetical protein